MSRSAAAQQATSAPGPAADARLAGQPGVTLVPLTPSRARRALAVRSRRRSAAQRSRAWTIEHNGRRYAVFSSDGELRVTDARCPHHGGPLADGVVGDGAVTCPWHWYCFDLRTGDCRTAAGYRLRTYPVLSQSGRLFAQLPGAARRRRWWRLWR